MKKIIFRADGNTIIGLGHVYRLLALAEMLNKDYECVFAINRPEPYLENQILTYCSAILKTDLDYTYKTPDAILPGNEFPFDFKDLLKGDEIVVTDGYFFGEGYQEKIKVTGAKLVCIDDIALNFFHANIVINHAPGIEKAIYRTDEQTKVLTGLDYAILRQPFFKAFVPRIDSEKAFISLGGSDAQEYTLQLLNFILKTNRFSEINILVSSAFKPAWLSKIENAIALSQNVRMHKGLNAELLVDVLDQCSHAFVAASTVLMEAYARGLQCFTGYYANNQLSIYNGFITEGLAAGLGHFDEINQDLISELLGRDQDFNIRETPLHSSEKIKKTFAALC